LRRLAEKHEEQHRELEENQVRDAKAALRHQLSRSVELARIERQFDEEYKAKVQARLMLEQNIERQRQHVPEEILWPYLRGIVEAEVAAERMDMEIA
jgi:hypothetical protein